MNIALYHNTFIKHIWKEDKILYVYIIYNTRCDKKKDDEVDNVNSHYSLANDSVFFEADTIVFMY